MSSAKRNVLDIRKERKESKTPRHAREVEVKTPDKPRVRLRDKRRRQRLLQAGGIVLGTFFVVGGLGAVTHFDRLALKSVTVFGAQELSTDALVAAVQSGLFSNRYEFFSRKNMFLYPRERIEESLSSDFPRIKDVKVEREALLSQAVMVTVVEREAHAVWCPQGVTAAEVSHEVSHEESVAEGAIDETSTEGATTTEAVSVPEDSDAHEDCFFMDSSGYIFAPQQQLVETKTPTLPYVFSGGLLPGIETVGQYFLRGRLYDSVSFLKKLERAGFTPLGLTVMNEKDFSVPLAEGPELYVPFDTDTTNVISRLESALAADGMREKVGTLEYIDLRFGNRVYYK